MFKVGSEEVIGFLVGCLESGQRLVFTWFLSLHLSLLLSSSSFPLLLPLPISLLPLLLQFLLLLLLPFSLDV